MSWQKEFDDAWERKKHIIGVGRPEEIARAWYTNGRVVQSLVQDEQLVDERDGMEERVNLIAEALGLPVFWSLQNDLALNCIDFIRENMFLPNRYDCPVCGYHQATQAAPDPCPLDGSELVPRLCRVEAEQLQEAFKTALRLLEYSDHLDGCAVYDNAPCDCGLEELKNAL
jgi:hypothetical protein